LTPHTYHFHTYHFAPTHLPPTIHLSPTLPPGPNHHTLTYLPTRPYLSTSTTSHLPPHTFHLSLNPVHSTLKPHVHFVTLAALPLLADTYLFTSATLPSLAHTYGLYTCHLKFETPRLLPTLTTPSSNLRLPHLPLLPHLCYLSLATPPLFTHTTSPRLPPYLHSPTLATPHLIPHTYHPTPTAPHLLPFTCSPTHTYHPQLPHTYSLTLTTPPLPLDTCYPTATILLSLTHTEPPLPPHTCHFTLTH
jgi:hypothetical protein